MIFDNNEYKNKSIGREFNVLKGFSLLLNKRDDILTLDIFDKLFRAISRNERF